MEIRVIDGRMATTQALLSHIHGRVERAMNRLSRRINRVEIHLEDINGPKGGMDKRCTIHARLRAGNPLIIEETGPEFYGAIDAAVLRLKRLVRKVIDRRKTNGARR